jgi:hypothetical protein
MANAKRSSSWWDTPQFKQANSLLDPNRSAGIRPEHPAGLKIWNLVTPTSVWSIQEVQDFELPLTTPEVLLAVTMQPGLRLT